MMAASLILLALLVLGLPYAIGARELNGSWPTLRNKSRWLAATAITAMATLAIGFTQPFTLPALFLLAALAGLLVAIAWLDLETGMLADLNTLALAALALAYDEGRFATLDDWLPTLGLAAGLLTLGWFLAGPYSRRRKRDMLGWGDVKFFAAAGLWLLPLQLPLFLILAGGIGALIALAYKLVTGRAETPFAPALCCALYACVVFGLSLNDLL